MEDAGYPDGFDTTLITISEQFQIDLYTAVCSYLNAVGIRAELDVLEGGAYWDIGDFVGWEGLLGAMLPSDPEIGHLLLFGFYGESPVAYAQMQMHTDEMDDIIEQSLQADYATREGLYEQYEYLSIDVHCIYTPVLLWCPIAVKSSKLQDEYTCTSDIYLGWTFADAWIED